MLVSANFRIDRIPAQLATSFRPALSKGSQAAIRCFNPATPQPASRCSGPKPDVGSKTVPSDWAREVQKLRTFARLFYLTVYFACLDPEGGPKGYWVCLDQLDEVPAIKRHRDDDIHASCGPGAAISYTEPFYAVFVRGGGPVGVCGMPFGRRSWGIAQRKSFDLRAKTSWLSYDSR